MVLRALAWGEGAREAVEDEAAREMNDFVADDVEHELVGDELSVVDEVADLFAQGRTGSFFGAEDVAAGQMNEVKGLADAGGLRALAGARRP